MPTLRTMGRGGFFTAAVLVAAPLWAGPQPTTPPPFEGVLDRLEVQLTETRDTLPPEQTARLAAAFGEIRRIETAALALGDEETSQRARRLRQRYAALAARTSSDPSGLECLDARPGALETLPTGTGSITGTVTSATSGLPIPGVTIGIYHSYCSGFRVATATTNASGVYSTAASLGTGTYYAYVMSVPDPSYLLGVWGEFTCFGACSEERILGGDPIAVTSPSATMGIDFSLITGGAIGGVASDAISAASIPGVDVRVYDAAGRFVQEVSTAADGSYQLLGLPAGNYYVFAHSNSAGYLSALYGSAACPTPSPCTVTDGTAVQVVPGALVSGIHFSLARGGRISGTVTSLAGYIPGANIRVHRSDGSYLTSATADAFGNYLTGQGLPPGSYYVSAGATDFIREARIDVPCAGVNCNFGPATPVVVTSGATTGSIDFELTRGGSIGGTVTSSGSPVQDASVWVFDGSGIYLGGALTDSSGDYTTSAVLPSGQYFARATNVAGTHVPELYNNITCVGCTVTAGTAISVTPPSTTTGVNFTLATGSRIQGQATQAITGSGAGSCDTTIYTSTGAAATVGNCDCDGIYATNGGLPAGTYYAVAYGNSDSLRPGLYGGDDCGSGCDVTTGSAISVDGTTDTTGVDFVLKPNRRPGDIDLDKNADVVWRHSSGAMYAWMMEGTTVRAGGLLPTVAPTWQVEAVSDFNGDGEADVLWREGASGSTYVWFLSGPTLIAQGFTASQADTTWTIQGVADFDGDRRSDILWRHSSGAHYLWLMEGLTPGAGSGFLPAVGATWSVAGLGDFDGDGRADILWREASGPTYVWFMNGPASVGGGFTSSLADLSWTVQDLGDLNGDGRADVLWRHSGGSAYLWVMEGVTAGPESGFLPLVGTDWTIEGLGDFDGDGRADILWRDVASGVSYLWLMNGTALMGAGFTSQAADTSWIVSSP
jgi:hypothetical protein